MIYYLPALEKAIGDRLLADTGSGGLFNVGNLLLAVHPTGASVGQGVYNTAIPGANTAGSTVFPAITFEITSALHDYESQRTRTLNVTVEFAVYVDRGFASNPIKRGSDILGRIIGDWTEQAAGTAPTYGLDRWQPTLAGVTWLPGIFLHQSDKTEHQETRFVWVSTYAINISKAGA